MDHYQTLLEPLLSRDVQHRPAPFRLSAVARVSSLAPPKAATSLHSAQWAALYLPREDRDHDPWSEPLRLGMQAARRDCNLRSFAARALFRQEFQHWMKTRGSITKPIDVFAAFLLFVVGADPSPMERNKPDIVRDALSQLGRMWVTAAILSSDDPLEMARKTSLAAYEAITTLGE